MNRRTELKLESAKIYLKKNILSGRYKVRNTLAVLTVAALVSTVGITVKAVTAKGDVVDNKSVSAMVAVNTQEAEKPETEYVINLSDDSYLAAGSIDTLKGRLDDSDAVLAEANSADNLTSSENDMTGKFIVTTEGLNLRKETSSDANILTVLNTGDYGDVIKTEGEWTFVAFCDKQGYLKTDYIITDDKATEVAEKAAKEGKTYRDVIGVKEVVPAKVAENAKKAQGSAGYTSHTVPLSKIAGYVKETDEVLSDNDFLASAVKDCMVYRLAKAEDKEIVTTILAASGTQSATYTDSGNTGDADSLVDGILYAKSLIDSATPYEASCVIMNPADFFALQTAKDDNGQYLGGGFFLGAYGNGDYKNAYNPWGLKVMTDSNVTSGTVIIAAEEAVKIYRKGSASVKVYEQNEDDALYNRVTILAEERVAPVVKVPAGVVILSAATA